MKKTFFVFIAVVFVSSLCFGFSTPPSAYQGEETKVITGEVVSVSMRTFVVADDKGDKTTISYKFGTTNSWLSAMDTLSALQNKRLEITYFVAKDGQKVATNIRDLANTK